MSGKRKVWHYIVGVCGVCAAGIMMAYLLNLCAALIPNKLIHDNIMYSAKTLESEGPFYHLISHNYNNTVADNNTDAVMLLMSDFDAEPNPFKKALVNEFKTYENTSNTGMFFFDMFVSSSHDNAVVTGSWNYARYWAGWLLPLRLLLIFLRYEDIRFVYQAVQLLLLVYILLRKYQKEKTSVWPLCGAIVFMTPIMAAVSFDYGFSYWVVLINLIIYDKIEAKIREDWLYFVIFFLQIGMTIAYLDFLTFPIFTLGFLMIEYISRNDEGVVGRIKRIVVGSISWAVGYGVMWSSKWAITGLFLGRSFLADALNQVKVRTSSHDGHSIGDIENGAEITIGGAIKNNIYVFDRRGMKLVGVIILITIIVIFVRKCQMKKTAVAMRQAALPYALCALMPVAWNIAYTYIHKNFTSNMYIVAMYAVLMFIAESYQRGQKESTQ